MKSSTPKKAQSHHLATTPFRPPSNSGSHSAIKSDKYEKNIQEARKDCISVAKEFLTAIANELEQTGSISTEKLQSIMPRFDMTDTTAQFAAIAIGGPLAMYAKSGKFTPFKISKKATEKESRQDFIETVFRHITNDCCCTLSAYQRRYNKTHQDLANSLSKHIKELMALLYKSKRMCDSTPEKNREVEGRIEILRKDMERAKTDLFSSLLQYKEEDLEAGLIKPESIKKSLTEALKKTLTQQSECLVVDINGHAYTPGQTPESKKRPNIWEKFIATLVYNDKKAKGEDCTSGHARLEYDSDQNQALVDALKAAKIEEYFRVSTGQQSSQADITRHGAHESKHGATHKDDGKYLSKPIIKFISMIIHLHTTEIQHLLLARTEQYIKECGNNDTQELLKTLQWRVIKSWMSAAIIRLKDFMGDKFPKLEITADDLSIFDMLTAIESELDAQDDMSFDNQMIHTCLITIIKSISDNFRKEREVRFTKEATEIHKLLAQSRKSQTCIKRPRSSSLTGRGRLNTTPTHHTSKPLAATDTENITTANPPQPPNEGLNMQKLQERIDVFEKPTALRVFLCILSGLTVVGPLVIILFSEHEKRVLKAQLTQLLDPENTSLNTQEIASRDTNLLRHIFQNNRNNNNVTNREEEKANLIYG